METKDNNKDFSKLEKRLSQTVFIATIGLYLLKLVTSFPRITRTIDVISGIIVFAFISTLFYCALEFVWTYDWFYLKVLSTILLGIIFLLLITGLVFTDKSSHPRNQGAEAHHKWHFLEYKKMMEKMHLEEDENISWEQRYKSLYKIRGRETIPL